MPYDVMVILDDRPGELARLGEVAGAAGVNLDGFAAFTHSSLVRRRAFRSISMRRAAVVFPVHGSPTVRNSVGRPIVTPSDALIADERALPRMPLASPRAC